MDAEGSDGGPETSRSLVMLGCEVGVRSAGLKAIYSIVMLVGYSIGWCVCASRHGIWTSFPGMNTLCDGPFAQAGRAGSMLLGGCLGVGIKGDLK